MFRAWCALVLGCAALMAAGPSEILVTSSEFRERGVLPNVAEQAD
jgi:hypothetical protein